MTHVSERVSPTARQLWNEYRRVNARVHVLRRETDEKWSAYQTAANAELEAREAAAAAHEAYISSLHVSAVIAAAENAVFQVPHLDFTD